MYQKSRQYPENPEFFTPYTPKICISEQVWPKPTSFKMSFLKLESGIQDQSGENFITDVVGLVKPVYGDVTVLVKEPYQQLIPLALTL